MSIKTRRFLFYSFLALFVILGTLIILYSRGLTIDFKNLSINRSGGVYIVSTPNEVSIALDGVQKADKSGLLQRGTLITGLAPDTYSLRLEKEGYLPWYKNFEVKSGEVSVFDTVVMLKDSELSLLRSGQFTNFDARSGNLALEEGGGIKLNDSQVLGHRIVSLTERGSLLTKSDRTGNYYITNTFDPEDGLNLSLVFNNLKENVLELPGYIQIKEAYPLPSDDKRFFVSTDRALYLLDMNNRTTLQLITSEYEYATLEDDFFIWSDGLAVYSFNAVFGNKSKLISFEEKKHVSKISKTRLGWMIISGGELTLYEENGKMKSLGIVTDFYVSSGDDRIAILDSSRNLKVIDLITQKTYENLGRSVENVIWYKDGAHLFVLEGGNLYFRDIAKGESVSSYQLSEGVQKLVYSDKEGKIYILKDNGVWELIL